MEKVNTRELLVFLGLAAPALVLPFFVHWQWLTGPIVNAILVIALFLVGIRSALVLCLVPSMMALSGGLIPAVLAPIVPFIMLGNIIFVIAIDRSCAYIRNEKKAYWVGLFVGAFLKFIFLFFSVNVIAKLLIKQELVLKVAQMLSWPQLATALSGGMLAWLVLKSLKKI